LTALNKSSLLLMVVFDKVEYS